MSNDIEYRHKLRFLVYHVPGAVRLVLTDGQETYEDLLMSSAQARPLAASLTKAADLADESGQMVVVPGTAPGKH